MGEGSPLTITPLRISDSVREAANYYQREDSGLRGYTIYSSDSSKVKNTLINGLGTDAHTLIDNDFNRVQNPILNSIIRVKNNWR